MAKIGVEILGDSSSLERAFKRSEVAAAEFNGRMNALGQTTRGAFAGAGFSKGSLLFGSSAFVGASVAAAGLSKSIQAASDLNEQLSKSNVVFGKSAKEISAWSESTATDIGVARRAALAAAATFGSVFVNTGRTREQAAEFSRTLVNLAGDLSSFNNASVDDALTALRSGLAGEIEPLRRFQVFLTEASVAQEALKETGKENVKQLTQGEKILARYNLILRQTTIQQGDYARTSGSVANQTRTLQANLDDAAAELGGTFLPALAAGLKGLNDFFAGLHHTITGLRDFRDELQSSKAFEGFNKDVATGTTSLSHFFLNIRDGIPFLSQLRGEIQGLAGDIGSVPKVSTPTIVEPGEGTNSIGSIERRNAAIADQAGKVAVDRFNAHMKGLNLKLDKAQLTKGFADDLAVLNEQLGSILRQEGRVGKTFELEQQRVSVLGQIQNINDQIANDALAKQQAREEKILGLKRKQREEIQKQLEAQRAALAAATDEAKALFGSLFQAQEQAQRTLTILGGSKGKQTVVLPGAGGGEDAKSLLGDLTTQIKSFRQLQANILELQRKGAPKSLLEAARTGEISADQINALASANSKTLNAIFRNVRLADRLVSKAAKAEINAKDVNLRANTVTIRGAVAAASTEHGRGGEMVIQGGVHLHGVQNVKQLEQELERRRKTRAQQTRGRSGGKR